MPRFSKHFGLGRTQYELDFVDISNEFDTQVYVDPYAIQLQTDPWAAECSDYIQSFFREVLRTLRSGDRRRAENLMSHLNEPKETFLGISKEVPKGRGVGRDQAKKLIQSIERSEAFSTGLLTDLSEMALYVEGIDRDKISDLTTNIIRDPLVRYTHQQCEIHGITTKIYNGPSFWDPALNNWRSKYVNLPYIDSNPILLVPKYIVRRKLSLDSQSIYDNQITDFLVAENLSANSSLVQSVKGVPKVYKKDVREKHKKSKNFIAEMIALHPQLLEMYKELAKRHHALAVFLDEDRSINAVCASISELFKEVAPGGADADRYHSLVMGCLTALFYPSLIQPRKEWEINDGRKRIDIVYTNAAESGFFSHRRNNHNISANTVIVECKNYSHDIANPEIDQLLGRFDENRGKFGILACRSVDNRELLQRKLVDASSRGRGFIICLEDSDIISMLLAKSSLSDNIIDEILNLKFRLLLE